MSRAITDLQATYRWVLTGFVFLHIVTSHLTEIIIKDADRKQSADVYGYVRFLKVRPWYDWSEFHREIGKLEKKRRQFAIAFSYVHSLTFYSIFSWSGGGSFTKSHDDVPASPQEGFTAGRQKSY